MPSNEIQLKTIKLLIEHEKAISALYKEYERKCPEQKDFWLRISDEEIEHANWISTLYLQVEKGSLNFQEERFKIEAIKTSLEYIKDRISEAQNKEISAKNALSVARDLENGLLEKKYFEVFESDSKEIKIILRRLMVATREHRNKIEKIWNGTR